MFGLGGVKQVAKIEGMKCEHCAAHVEEAIKGIEGVKSCKVDLVAKTATIKSKAGVSEEQVKAALAPIEKEFVGFEK